MISVPGGTFAWDRRSVARKRCRFIASPSADSGQSERPSLTANFAGAKAYAKWAGQQCLPKMVGGSPHASLTVPRSPGAIASCPSAGVGPICGGVIFRMKNGVAMSTIASGEPIVFVVDDNADVRESLKALLESVGLQCRAFDSAKEFLGHGPHDGPTCLILDVRLPEISGLDVQAELARGSRRIPIIIITGYGDVRMSVQAMKAGALGFLTKPVHEQDLLDAVYEAIDKDRVRLNAESKNIELRERYENLTVRERQVFPLITSGLLNKQIAAEVDLSEVTVKVHRHKLMAKMNAKRLPDLVRMADELGIRSRA
jgi:FixJ family two-component response regulator